MPHDNNVWRGKATDAFRPTRPHHQELGVIGQFQPYDGPNLAREIENGVDIRVMDVAPDEAEMLSLLEGPLRSTDIHRVRINDDVIDGELALDGVLLGFCHHDRAVAFRKKLKLLVLDHLGFNAQRPIGKDFGSPLQA